ncbi:MAG: hypothetical protein WB723_08335, partial [Candidatus Acidiferrales bacterium]
AKSFITGCFERPSAAWRTLSPSESGVNLSADQVFLLVTVQVCEFEAEISVTVRKQPNLPTGPQDAQNKQFM